MDWQINKSAFKVQVLSTLVCPGDFKISQFASAMHRQKKKNSQRPNRYFCIYIGMPRHFAKGYDLVFKQLRLLVLPNHIVYLWNTWISETEDAISLVDHLVWVSSYVFVGSVWKTRVSNANWVITESQLMTQKKTKRLTRIQFLTKDFTSKKIR